MLIGGISCFTSSAITLLVRLCHGCLLFDLTIMQIFFPRSLSPRDGRARGQRRRRPKETEPPSCSSPEYDPSYHLPVATSPRLMSHRSRLRLLRGYSSDNEGYSREDNAFYDDELPRLASQSTIEYISSNEKTESEEGWYNESSREEEEAVHPYVCSSCYLFSRFC